MKSSSAPGIHCLSWAFVGIYSAFLVYFSLLYRNMGEGSTAWMYHLDTFGVALKQAVLFFESTDISGFDFFQNRKIVVIGEIQFTHFS